MSFFIEGSWKEWFLEGVCGNRQQLGGAMRLDRIRGRFAFGFAPGFRFMARRLCATAAQAGLALHAGARQNPPFVFQQQFLYSPRLVTTNLPGDNTIQ
ncbi:hypothetical protein [Variovorax sp. E3]|jgi:hypothetical protein|uniref:hypothetical protein n=1 Tax=Variovorax sp. E3 TaxID=1914993 RepID=UPI0018DC62F2|nr:hypothetical protein [Variovorax sp. E3]